MKNRPLKSSQPDYVETSYTFHSDGAISHDLNLSNAKLQ